MKQNPPFYFGLYNPHNKSLELGFLDDAKKIETYLLTCQNLDNPINFFQMFLEKGQVEEALIWLLSWKRGDLSAKRGN